MLDSEDDEGEEMRTSHYKLSWKEVDNLLKAIYTTLDIQAVANRLAFPPSSTDFLGFHPKHITSCKRFCSS